MRKGLLFVISGPSGAGKGSIYKGVLERLDMDFSVSMTTRAPRPDEVDGKDYYFVTEEEYRLVLEEDGFLERAQVYGNHYGTPKAEVLDRLEKGRDVLLDIDVQGALQVRKNFPAGVLIFILPPSMEELRRRLTGRGTETEEVINKRLGQAMQELGYVGKYDYCVINDRLDEATEQVIGIIRTEHLRVSEEIDDLIEKYKVE